MSVELARSVICIYLLNTVFEDSCLHEQDMAFATIYSAVVCSVQLVDSCLHEQDMAFATIYSAVVCSVQLVDSCLHEQDMAFATIYSAVVLESLVRR